MFYGQMIGFGSGGSLYNYYGTGDDGAKTVASSENITVTEDAGPVIKHYTSLTVNASQTFSTSHRCKGFLIYCTGNVVVNGTISMTSKGSRGDPGADLNLFRVVASGTSTGTANQTVFPNEVLRTNTLNKGAVTWAGPGIGEFKSSEVGGAAGGGGRCMQGGGALAAGASNTQSCGGGGGGGAHYQGNCGHGGDGSDGTAWCGGAGGGGQGINTPGVAGAGGAYGGDGGVGQAGGGTGAGNHAGGVGMGGFLCIIAKGSVTIGSGGIIENKGGTATGGQGGGGGGGAGRIIILHGGTYTNSGTIDVDGGAGAPNGSQWGRGGGGGAGYIQVQAIGQ